MKLNIDERELSKEKLSYKFMGCTSLFTILGIGSILISHLEWAKNLEEMFSGPVAYSSAVIFILFIYGIVAQIKAIKYHNKNNPSTPINWNRSDGYRQHFEELDEGAKFEKYRVAHKSFSSMNNVFPAVLLLLLFISQIIGPQYIAIGIVSLLWLTMYLIYYREGYKTYK